jgi:hypothetical protein
MGGSTFGEALDALLAPDLREQLEDRFWRPIQDEAKLEVLRTDPGFLADPASHPGLFADHGVVHVRDTAAGFLEVGTTVDGVLLPGRSAERQRFLLAYRGMAIEVLE